MTSTPDPVAQYLVRDEPFYRPVGSEVELFQSAVGLKLPVMLKGPTGCGKTRFVEYMAWKLGRPLITVACHEDLTASDLVGRYLIRDQDTVWVDGPLTTAVRLGAICYLDEVVEARNDTVVVIHPLTDDRRVLPIEKRATQVQAHPDFQLVVSYNPGYQSVIKDLKQSTRQRFLALDFDYPSEELETGIVATESGVSEQVAGRLVRAAQRIRNLRNQGLDEGVSTRLLVYTGSLIKSGVDPLAACRAAMVLPLTDDPELARSMVEIVRDFF